MLNLETNCIACRDTLLNQPVMYHRLWEYNNDKGFYDPGNGGWWRVHVDCSCGKENYLEDLGVPLHWKIAIPRRFQGWTFNHLQNYLQRNPSIGRKVDTYV